MIEERVQYFHTEAHLYCRTRSALWILGLGVPPPCCKTQPYWDGTHSLRISINCKKKEQREKYNYKIVLMHDKEGGLLKNWLFYLDSNSHKQKENKT